MIHPGLVSITFRELSPREIVKLVADGGLVGIEWGGEHYALIEFVKGDRPASFLAGATALREWLNG